MEQSCDESLIVCCFWRIDVFVKFLPKCVILHWAIRDVYFVNRSTLTGVSTDTRPWDGLQGIRMCTIMNCQQLVCLLTRVVEATKVEHNTQVAVRRVALTLQSNDCSPQARPTPPAPAGHTMSLTPFTVQQAQYSTKERTNHAPSPHCLASHQGSEHS